MIISFSLTTNQFLQGIKTETRRLWKPRTIGLYYEGSRHSAWNYLPFIKDARPLAHIRAIQNAFIEPLNAISLESVCAEGFPDFSTDDFIEFFLKEANSGKAKSKWITPDIPLAVAKFQILQFYD